MPTASSTPQSTRTLLLGIWRHLNRRRRMQLGLLLMVMLASSGAELLSLGAILPFLAVLSDPKRLWHQPQIHALAARAGFTQEGQLLLPAVAVFAIAAVLAAIVRLANQWLNGRLAAAVGSDLSCDAYRRTLYQPYSVHVRLNSSAMITAITSHVGGTIGALTALLQLFTAFVVALGLLLGLILIDWQVALVTLGLFGSTYCLLAITTHQHLQLNSQQISTAAGQQIKALQEGLGAIRDVLLEGSQPTYVQIYREADQPQRFLTAQNQFISTFPRYVLEALGIVAIAVLGGLLVLQRGGSGSVIPLLGALALGAQRLLPSLQQVYAGWASLRASNASLAGILSLLQQPLPVQLVDVTPLVLRQNIKLETIRFRYGSEQPLVLNGLDFEIRRGERIGLIGTTGSGKSTTVDLLMGLLEPSAGRLLVDGLDVHDHHHPERLMAWRTAIAHVPQSIYLTDSSIAENIAFGVPKTQIDLTKVRQAAVQAQIASFIESNVGGYDTYVGERGIRLSGGQRQRIGIARALYKQSSVLVFDEATSALDISTEEALMKAIDGLSNELTIVIIAHRLNTVVRCDRIIELANGIAQRILSSDDLRSEVT